MRKGFNFYRSYWEVLEDLPNPMDRLSYLEALLDRQFTGKEPSLEGLSKIVYNGQKYSIDKSVEGYEFKTGTKLTQPHQGSIKGGNEGPTEGGNEGPTEGSTEGVSGDIVMTTEGPTEGSTEGPSLQEQELEQEKEEEEEEEQEEELVENSLNSLDPEKYIDYILQKKIYKL